MKTLTGALLVLFPLLIQVPYALLMAHFDYPHILREPPSVILTRYAAGGPSLTLTWYAFGLAILPLLVAIALLPSVAPSVRPAWLKAATPLGIASAILQMLGLLRWVVLVPLLAQAYKQAQPAERAVLEAVFLAQHQLFGVLMGEHLGQILLALWTAGVVLALPCATRLEKTQHALGLAAAALFLVGSGESLATVFPALNALRPLPGLAFLVWSVWCLLLGTLLLRPALAKLFGRHAEPALAGAVEHARLREAQ